MGQYYLIVNLDKKEYFNPLYIGKNGEQKLVALASSLLPMWGLSLLCSSGNGRGGGDFYRTVTGNRRIRKTEKIDHSYENEGKKIHVVVPAISGRWAGDRIVIAGDYADNKAFLTGKEHKQAIAAMIEKLPNEYLSKRAIKLLGKKDAHIRMEERRKRLLEQGTNLYGACQYGLFKDITKLISDTFKERFK
jgi:hypothetical protein